MLSLDCPVVALYSRRRRSRLSVMPILHFAGSSDDCTMYRYCRRVPVAAGGVQNSVFVKLDIILPLVLGFVAVGVVPIREPRPPWMRIWVE